VHRLPHRQRRQQNVVLRHVRLQFPIAIAMETSRSVI
jgi:hypothetical protein